MRVFKFPYPMLLLAIWTGVLAGGDWIVAETSFRQMRANGFATTLGEITRSELGRGATRQAGINIVYSYTVRGIGYKGSHYRYDERNGVLDYEAITNAFPRGSRKAVFYNPNNPADSVLVPGISGVDLLLWLFAIPLNIVTIAPWWTFVRGKFAQRNPARPGGMQVFQRPGETRVRLAEFSPGAAGFFGMAMTSCACAMFIVSTQGFAASPALVSGSFLVVAGVGAASALWMARRQQSGCHDLRIDEAAQTLVLPPADGRTEPLLIPRHEIVAVSVRRRVSDSPSGQYFSYVPALERTALDGQSQSLGLVNWGWTEGKARAFSSWLSQQLGVRFRAID